MSFDWLAIFKYVRPSVLAGGVLTWLCVIEPLFSTIALLVSFDQFIVKKTGPWGPPALHFCIAYLAVLLMMHAWSSARTASQCRASLKAEADRKSAELNARAKIFSSASPEEKLILRVFIDNGISSTGSRFFGEYLQPLAEAASIPDTQIAKAVSRLRARDLLYMSETDVFHIENGYSISEATFAFLSANPRLIDSIAPVRLMFSKHNQLSA